jgi:hypothetical protein
MQEAMRNAKYVDILSGHVIFDSLGRAGSTHRAWQELPRHLRRRAASHNVRRVPLRLRNRSRAEVRNGSQYPCMVLRLIHPLQDELFTSKDPWAITSEARQRQT